MNILVINLTRFGDLLQTQPVIHALKAQGHRVGLLCLKNFAPATALLEGVDYTAVLPGGAFLAAMDSDWRMALAQVQNLVQEVQEHFPLDGIVNTTATLSARLLARRLTQPGMPVWGFALDAEGFGVNGNAWATFLQGSTMRRLNCPFNIVDMFRMAAGCGQVPAVNRLCPPGESIQSEARALLREKFVPHGTADLEHCAGYVSFQLGASEARRQWPVEYFALLGQWLWQHLHLCPILLGAPAERPLAEAYAAALPPDVAAPFVDCVGGTDIPHLAGLLLCSRLLVTNDTGTMHLAAGLDVPVLAMFLATAQAWDTGPYRADCCCLEPALTCHPCSFDSPCTCQGEQACLHSIRPERVWDLVQGHVRTGQWSVTDREHDGARVWLTCTDAWGFADLRCISSHGTEDRSVWLGLQRHFYRQIIDSMDGLASLAVGQPSSASALSPEFCRTVHTVLRQAESLLQLLEQQGTMLERMPGPVAGQKLLATCNRVHTLFEQCVPLCALGHLWTVVLQERGGDLGAILQMARIFQQSLKAWRLYLESVACCE